MKQDIDVWTRKANQYEKKSFQMVGPRLLHLMSYSIKEENQFLSIIFHFHMAIN